MAAENAVIIKRVKKGDHGGHHGGAWKVAYADFVTAMMAFFLLMWLINTTTPEQKRGIADYFAAQSISQSTSGAGGVLGGTVLGPTGGKAGGTMSVVQNQNPTMNNTAHAQARSRMRGGATQAQGTDPASQTHSDEHLQSALPSAQDGAFASAAEAIHQAMQTMPDIAKLSRQVIVDQTPKGLRIQLVDQDGRPMFRAGSATPMPYTVKLLQTIAKVIDALPNRIAISGHTDGSNFDGPNGMTNWELSAERADASRAILESSGVRDDQIYEVTGKAGSEPLLPEDPDAPANRRISIVVMREAPPIPPHIHP
ncbi:MAG: OmpA family protein [Alphaproteobacteria bacterium]|nr:OmpA family protein [Alphaproteobacteria bacterium]